MCGLPSLAGSLHEGAYLLNENVMGLRPDDDLGIFSQIHRISLSMRLPELL
jgi:hypothetical protein